MQTTAERLRGIAERNGWIGAPTSMGSWYCPALENEPRERQTESYLVESLHCVLTHAEPLIALRAFGQASAYHAQLWGKIPTAHYGDALIEARNRLESLIRGLRFES